MDFLLAMACLFGILILVIYILSILTLIKMGVFFDVLKDGKNKKVIWQEKIARITILSIASPFMVIGYILVEKLGVRP